MKKLILLAAFLYVFSASTNATVLYENTNGAGGSFGRGAPSGSVGGPGAPTNGVWNIRRSTEEDAGNNYLRYDFIVTSDLSSSTRAYGGFEHHIGAFTSLPSAWRLSFDLYLNSLEPVFVVLFSSDMSWSPLGGFPGFADGISYWVQPPDAGWQNVTVDSGMAGSFLERAGVTVESGTYLQIALSSQDAIGNQLSTSRQGSYSFLLDNIRFESIPEPSCLILLILGGVLVTKMNLRQSM